jgi:hypothetical protein
MLSRIPHRSAKRPGLRRADYFRSIMPPSTANARRVMKPLAMKLGYGPNKSRYCCAVYVVPVAYMPPLVPLLVLGVLMPAAEVPVVGATTDPWLFSDGNAALGL